MSTTNDTVAGGHVLVVEDDPAIQRGLIDALTFAGYEAEGTADGLDALQRAGARAPDLVLLDVMLPGADGFTVLARLRERSPQLPIIMVTARGAEEDRVAGLSAGADDYVVKPFSAKELLARVAAVLRRAPERPQHMPRFEVMSRRVDLVARRVLLPDGREASLSERETELLGYLAAAGLRPVERAELLRQVWGLDPKGLHTRTVDMHVARLRGKLGDDGGEPEVLLTVRGKGYRLAEVEPLP
ncbi:MAG: DNA-binding response regulator [Planctomycetota bacterium]|nr:MAG: DNA-binding response regulator [Planctomycetota bacterium]